MEKPEKQSVKWPSFSRRLRQACDTHPVCPPLHKGRQVWLRDRLAELKVDVEIESIRKWLAGEMRPREAKAEALAKVLGVDPVALFMGWESRSSLNVVDSDSLPRVAGLPIQIRADLTVQLVGLPFDLTKSEAQKIANIVLAYGGALGTAP
jgi:hypothetical protein